MHISVNMVGTTRYSSCVLLRNMHPYVLLFSLHSSSSRILMRGCFLGVTLISHIVLSIKQNLILDQTRDDTFSSRHGILLANSMSTVVFIWPMCYVVHILLEMNFSESQVHENASILVLIVPCITWGLSLLWSRTWKCLVVDTLLRILYKIIARFSKKA
jgi:hypothetical protein